MVHRSTPMAPAPLPYIFHSLYSFFFISNWSVVLGGFLLVKLWQVGRATKIENRYFFESGGETLKVVIIKSCSFFRPPPHGGPSCPSLILDGVGSGFEPHARCTFFIYYGENRKNRSKHRALSVSTQNSTEVDKRAYEMLNSTHDIKIPGKNRSNHNNWLCNHEPCSTW